MPDTTGAVQSAGAKLYIAAPPADTVDTAAEYEALTPWVEIGDITNFGEFGRAYGLITHNPVGNRKTFKFKGARNDGSMTLAMARAPSDAGQALAASYLDSDLKPAFRMVLNDDQGDSPRDESKFYFRALVMSYPLNVGDVNSIVASTLTLEIDGDIVSDLAT